MTDLRTLADRDCIGIVIVIVDHGSHRAESNRRHEDFVAERKLRSGYTIVEAAHMELAEPSIGTAFDACVAAGATTIVVAPYLLWPGSHWERDVPALAAEASTRHRDVAFLVTAPLGPHPLLMTIVDDRIRYCVAHATGEEPECAMSGQVSTFTAGTLAELATVLVKARVARGWTQRQLAEALGVAEQQIQRYEANGYRSTSLARLCDIADALSVRVEQRAELKPSAA